MSKRLICGVGINDADYPVTSRVDGKYWKCPFYSVWKSMIERGYSAYTKDRQPYYKDKYVCNEWHTFSNFKAWMETQDWEGNQLDKDLIVPGNKVYSPETCMFVSSQVNNFFLSRGSERGEWPLGVHYDKRKGKFKAFISELGTGRNKNLGSFNTPDEAHNAWLDRKKQLAVELAALQTDDRISKALLGVDYSKL